MSRIKTQNTTPEMIIRKGLFARGFRYSLHKKTLPGKPDIVLPKYHSVIFVNGCFWHMHSCRYFVLPKTRTSFWQDKLEKNRERDLNNTKKLLEMGWRVAIVWECSIKNKQAVEVDEAFTMLSDWLVKGDAFLEL